MHGGLIRPISEHPCLTTPGFLGGTQERSQNPLADTATLMALRDAYLVHEQFRRRLVWMMVVNSRRKPDDDAIL